MISSGLYFGSCSSVGSIVHLNPRPNSFVDLLCRFKCFDTFSLVVFGDFHFVFSKYFISDSQLHDFKSSFFAG